MNFRASVLRMLLIEVGAAIALPFAGYVLTCIEGLDSLGRTFFSYKLETCNGGRAR